MQLQKPVGRPTAPPPRRPEPGSKTGSGAEATPPVSRPTAPSAPRRPYGARPGAPGQRRPGRPDWDDSAKLEALRSRSPQKQRQKVHIIGENDDALTAETGGFAGEQQAMVLSASLARPAKPKSQQRSAPKPVAAPPDSTDRREASREGVIATSLGLPMGSSAAAQSAAAAGSDAACAGATLGRDTWAHQLGRGATSPLT